MALADMRESWKIAEGLWWRSQESQRPKEGVGWEKSLAASRMKLVFFFYFCQQKCRQSGREKMKLRSVIYGWAIWWSIYICGSSAACSVRRDTFQHVSSHVSLHVSSHISHTFHAHLTHVSRMSHTCLTLTCGSAVDTPSQIGEIEPICQNWGVKLLI